MWEGGNNTGLDFKQFLSRINIIFTLVIICFIILLARLLYFQVIRGTYYHRIATENSTYMYIERAPRGIIYDINRNVLSFNKPFKKILFYPFVKKTKLSANEINRIENLIPGSRQKLFMAYSSGTVTCLYDNVDRITLLKILEIQHNLPGISVETELRRFYPYDELASQLIGYIGEIDTNELNNLFEKGYRQGDMIGKIGLEKKYNDYLHGKDGGVLIESDAFGKQLTILEKIEPVPGNDLYLTINRDLQAMAESELLKTGCAGAVVGIDPRNGAIRIMASVPGYNPNLFVTMDDKRMEYMQDKKLPMYNRAIQAQFAPGSVFKIITSLSALNENIITPEKTFYCPGYFKIGAKTFRCWEAKGHGTVNFLTGVTKSCDVYFYNIGLLTGVDNIMNYASEFGFGKYTGIDIPSERPGSIPTKEWREKKNLSWYNGDTVNIAIGQGYIDVTPLQLALMVSVMANKGILWKPYVVAKITNKSGQNIYFHKPEKSNTINNIRPEVWKLVEDALLNVVNTGTGYGANVPGLEVAGKTGTAENPHGKTHAWFSAYAPVKNPELAIAVLVQHGGKGGSVAAPIAKQILMKAFMQ